MIVVASALMTRTLGSICDEVGGIIRTGPFGSQLHESDYTCDGTPVVMPKDLVNGGISDEGIARIGDANVERLSQHKLKLGDIVYGRRGDIGRRALITEREAGWLCGTGCLRISLGNDILNPQYLYYYLGQPRVVSWIANQAVGATLPNLNTSIIRSIEVTYPPLPIQRKIAAILSAYDDLIENNTRRIALLEAMAQALYREWFVHFRFPGHQSVPLVNSPLGPIPEGWQVVKLGDVVTLERKAIDPSRYPDEIFAHYSIPAFDDGKMVVCEAGEAIKSSKYLLPEDCVLVSKINPRIPRVWMPRLSHAERGVASTEFLVLLARPGFTRDYIFSLCSASDFLKDMAGRAMGTSTSHQRIKPDDFLSLPTLRPEESVIEVFTGSVSPMFAQDNLLRERNANLRRQRDLLLPKLVSGEMDVSEVEIADMPA